MGNIIILLTIVVIVFAIWFVVPHYIALFHKDVTRIRSSATFSSLFKAEQEIEKKAEQPVGDNSEDANGATGEN